jgi:hypothetical protein
MPSASGLNSAARTGPAWIPPSAILTGDLVVLLCDQRSGSFLIALDRKSPNHNPALARLVTRDIPNFWRVVDQASLISAAELFQRDYLDPGTTGLHDFLATRIQNSRLLAAVVAARSRA